MTLCLSKFTSARRHCNKIKLNYDYAVFIDGILAICSRQFLHHELRHLVQTFAHFLVVFVVAEVVFVLVIFTVSSKQKRDRQRDNQCTGKNQAWGKPSLTRHHKPSKQERSDPRDKTRRPTTTGELAMRFPIPRQTPATHNCVPTDLISTRGLQLGFDAQDIEVKYIQRSERIS